jgi:homoserine acetyltransferase
MHTSAGARDGRNAILCTHGYTGSHHVAGRNPANGNQPGSSWCSPSAEQLVNLDPHL